MGGVVLSAGAVVWDESDGDDDRIMSSSDDDIVTVGIMWSVLTGMVGVFLVLVIGGGGGGGQ